MMHQAEAHKLVARMLDFDNPDFEVLRRQLVNLEVVSLAPEDRSSFKLIPHSFSDDDLLADQFGVFVDAEAEDDDGHTIYALLHILHGRLAEVDIYRGDGGEPNKQLEASDFQIVYRG